MKTFLITSAIVIYSCNNTSQNKLNTDSMAAENVSTNKGKDTIRNSEVNDSVIYIRFPADSISTTVSGKMKGMKLPVTVLIPIRQGKQLIASLKTEDSLANIRINQIFTPDGKADGPFGRELKLVIKQQGTYKLIIAENLMQGDEWKGKFNLTVNIQ